MKQASAALITFLNSQQQFYLTDLYTLTLVGGFTVRYTSWDQDITLGGNTFASWRIERSKTRVVVGVEVDTLDVTVFPYPTDLLNGMAWLTAVQRGALDSAVLKVERLFMPSPGDTSLGTIHMFEGRVSDTKASRTEATLNVKSQLELLNVNLPRNLYQGGCLHTLFDNGCGLNKAAYAVGGTIVAATLTDFNSTISAPTDNFTLGTVRFTSGANNGVTRSVRFQSGGQFVFALPLTTPPLAGDTFLAWPGCNKMKDTCSSKFNNLVNFRGFPFVPVPETST